MSLTHYADFLPSVGAPVTFDSHITSERCIPTLFIAISGIYNII